jgi:hypothetical protein
MEILGTHAQGAFQWVADPWIGRSQNPDGEFLSLVPFKSSMSTRKEQRINFRKTNEGKRLQPPLTIEDDFAWSQI